MPGRISELTAIGGAAATTDQLEILDVSDTTDPISGGPAGANKRWTLTEVVTFLAANGLLSQSAVATVAQGGTGRNTATTAHSLIAAGSTPTGIQQSIAPAASGFLKTTSTSALPAWAAIAAADVSGLGALATATTPITVAQGGTGVATLTGVLKGNGTGAVTASAQLAVADGGTGAATLTGVLKGNGTGAFTASAILAVADGGTGANTLTGVLKGNGTGAVTASATLAVADGGTGRNTGTTAYGLIAAGITATGAHQTVAPAASGFLKTTNAAALPAWTAITGADIANDTVTNTQLATMATLTIKGNATGGTAGPTDLSVAAVRSMTASGAGSFFGFDFDTTVTLGPAATRLRLNNATPASATIVWVSYTSKDGVDLKTRLLAGTAGDRLYIQDRLNSANYRIYELTGAPVDATTYATCNVVHRGGGGSLWANSTEIIAGFTSPPITVGGTAPTGPLVNDLWVDTT